MALPVRSGSPRWSDVRHLLSIDDLDADSAGSILDRAGQIRRREATPVTQGNDFVASLVFLSSSLRTRVGFSVAVARMGGTTVHISDLRVDPSMTGAESLDDAIRVVTGMTDVVVLRTPALIDRTMVVRLAVRPVICGGDGGGNHPSQALIDLAAMEERGPVGELRVGICGDLSGRAALSLLGLLRLRPPRTLRLMQPEEILGLPVCLPGVPTEVVRGLDVEDLDVLYLAGLPGHVGGISIDRDLRAAFAITKRDLARLHDDALILSPMPVIDEIDPEVRLDPRLGIYLQSDLGVSIRMAILESVMPTSDPE